jgi:hypothetical protein
MRSGRLYLKDSSQLFLAADNLGLSLADYPARMFRQSCISFIGSGRSFQLSAGVEPYIRGSPQVATNAFSR